MSDKAYPRILIIDDDEDQRMLLREALCVHYGDPEGENITEAATAAECLAHDLAAFDVVLQDYHLPDMEGMKLLKAILDRAHLPVILVTGENDSSTVAQAIQLGAQDYVVKLGDYLLALPTLVDKNIGQHRIKKENERLRRELEAMLCELQVKNRQLQESMVKLEDMAGTDTLTGLDNRRRFDEQLHHHCEEAIRYGHELSCCMCDLDNYKAFNDTFGHNVGDEILIRVGEAIRSCLRSSDVAARWGGDEFSLLLPHTSLDKALAIGERIRKTVVAWGGDYGELGSQLDLSGGVASLRGDNAQSAEGLLTMADRALCAAKSMGKGRIVLHSAIRGGFAAPVG